MTNDLLPKAELHGDMMTIRDLVEQGMVPYESECCECTAQRQKAQITTRAVWLSAPAVLLVVAGRESVRTHAVQTPAPIIPSLH